MYAEVVNNDFTSFNSRLALLDCFLEAYLAKFIEEVMLQALLSTVRSLIRLYVTTPSPKNAYPASLVCSCLHMFLY